MAQDNPFSKYVAPVEGAAATPAGSNPFVKYVTPPAPVPPAPTAPSPTALDYAKLGFRGLVKEAPLQFASTVAGMIEGPEGVEPANPDIGDQIRGYARRSGEKYAQEVRGKLGDTFKAEMVQAIPSLGYSAATLPVTAAATALGTIAGTAAGGAAGLPTGPGALTTAGAGAVSGAVAGLGAGYLAMDRAAQAQILGDLAAQEEQRMGRPFTESEFAAFKANLDDKVAAYGGWEAGPEALSNVIDLAILRRVPGAGALVGLGKKALGIAATELPTETITQIGQSQALEGTSQARPDGPLSFRSPQDVGTAAREVLPGVLVVGGGMTVANAALEAVADKVKGNDAPAAELRQRALDVAKFKVENPGADLPEGVAENFLAGTELTGEAPAVEPPVEAPTTRESQMRAERQAQAVAPEPTPAPERLVLSAPVNISLASGEVIPAQQFYRMLNERLDAKAGGMTKEEVIRSRRRLMKEEQQFFEVQAIKAVPEEQRSGAEKAKLTKYNNWLAETVPAEAVTEQKELVNDLSPLSVAGPAARQEVQESAVRVQGGEVAKPRTPAAREAQMQADRRSWIDTERKTNPSFAPDTESWKELLPPVELAEVNEWEDLQYKSVALQGPEAGYKPYKLTTAQKGRLQELSAKYQPRQQAEIGVVETKSVNPLTVPQEQATLSETSQGETMKPEPKPTMSITSDAERLFSAASAKLPEIAGRRDLLLRVAEGSAKLDGKTEVSQPHLAEAVQYVRDSAPESGFATPYETPYSYARKVEVYQAAGLEAPPAPDRIEWRDMTPEQQKQAYKLADPFGRIPFEQFGSIFRSLLAPYFDPQTLEAVVPDDASEVTLSSLAKLKEPGPDVAPPPKGKKTTPPAGKPDEAGITSPAPEAVAPVEAPPAEQAALPRLKRGYTRATFTVADPVYKNYTFVEDVSPKGVKTLYTRKTGETEVKAATPAIAAKVGGLEKLEAKFEEGVDEVTDADRAEVRRLMDLSPGNEMQISYLPGADPMIALTKAIAQETGQSVAAGTFTQVAPPKGQEALFAALAQTLKKEIVFFKNNGAPMTFNGATGIAEDTIYVNIDSVKPHLVVTGHEFLHDLKREEPETYAALRDVVMDVIPEKRRLEMWKGLTAKRLREGRGPISMTAIDEELVADFFGEQFTSKEFWAKVERRNPEGFAGLVQRLIAFLDRIKAALTGVERADIERAQTAAAEALARYVSKNPEAEYELRLSEPPPAVRVLDDRRYVMSSYREAGLSKVEPTTKAGTSAGRIFGTFDGNELVDSNEYNGTKGNKNHITRTDFVWIPTKVAANLRGVMGEKREWSAKGFGNFTATKWKELKKDIFLNGFEEPIFITQDYGQRAKVSEGNHRIQAAEQLGLTHIPAEIRYFGRSEEDGLVFTPKKAEDFGLVDEAKFSETPKKNLQALKDSLLSGRVTTQALPSVLKVTPLPILADVADTMRLPWVRTFYKATMQRDAVSNGIVTDFGLLGKELAQNKETSTLVANVADVASIHQMRPQDDIYSQDWIAEAMRGAEGAKPETKEALLKGAQTAWEAAGMQTSTGKTFREAYLASKQAFDALPEDLQEHYLRAVEMMKDLRQREKDAAQALIEEHTQDNPELRAEQIAQLDFAYNNLKGNYWPVYRKGDYTLDYIETATGLRGYSSFDTVFEREVVAKSLVDSGLVDPATIKPSKKADAPRGGFGVPQGYNIALGRAIEEKAIAAATEGIDPKDVQALETATAQARQTAQETIQTLHEVWLRFQPEASAAKNMMRRKNIKGYDGDMVRGFLEYGQTHGVKVAQMEQGRKVERTINDMAAAIRGMSGDTTREMAILNDLRAREAVKSQPSHWLAKKLGAWTTFRYMTSPSIALVQMTQLGILTFPKLATLTGSNPTKAAGALRRGTQAAFSTKFTRDQMLGDTAVQAVYDSLHEVVKTETRRENPGQYDDVPLGTAVYTPAELQNLIDKLTPYQQQLLALQEAMDRGLLDISLSHEVNEQVERKDMNPITGRVFDLGMTFMRESEKASRKAAILAAFEVGGGQQDFFAGMETVAEVVDNTLFNYSKSAKGVALQGDLVRVLTTFQTFRINAIGKLFVLFRQTIKGETAEVQQAAKRELIGIFGMSGILAGTLGMPFAPLIFQLFDAIVGDDDDEPAEEQFRKWLAENFGQATSDVVAEGLPSLLGASLSRRIGLGDVVGSSAEMPARLVGDGALNWYATQLAGPSYSMVAGYAKGYNEIFNEGEVIKGLISSTPKPIGDALKAYGYATDGVKTGMGKRLLKADQVDANEVLLQAFGFAPLEISRMKAAQYDLNTRSTRLSMQWGQIKQDLVKAYIDGEPTDDEMTKVREFLAAHPGLVQNAGGEIRSSLREHLKKDAGLDSRREMLLKR